MELDDLLRRIAAKIQITRAQHSRAVQHYESVSRVLSESDWPLAKFSPQVYPQGSFRIQTTNRPKGRKEFDLDFVCEFLSMYPDPWQPDRLLDEVYRFFKSRKRYNSLVERKTRCIRINYAGDFHLDILLAVPDW